MEPSYEDWKETKAVALGTTIMGVAYNGGVILGADSRTSTGDFVANRASDKITKLADKVYICRSGSAADTQNLSMYVQHYIQQHEMEIGRDIEVQTAANLAMQIAYNNKSMLQAGLIVGGWDKRNGGQVWGIPLGGSLVNAPFHIGGSGGTYITAFCDKHWKPNMTEEECKQFMIKAISLAYARDGSSGGCIRLVIINEKGVKREFYGSDTVPPHYGEQGLTPVPSGIRA